ncbi:MAG: hypothetical protein JNM75_04035 [Rhodospirillales bacterium]|nr:hypothetical protein [Rhodospirillales bacterium]
MATIEDYTDAELGKLVRNAAKGREQEAVEQLRSKSGFVIFLEEIGLEFLAELIAKAAASIWEGVISFIKGLF